MVNLRLFFVSLLALIFLILAFVLNPWFIAGAVILALINQKEMMKATNKK